MARTKGSKNGHRNKILRKCLHCGKEFWKWPSDIKIGYGLYCSQDCANKSSGRSEKLRIANTGRKHTDEEIKKMCIFQKERYKNFTIWNKGMGNASESKRIKDSVDYDLWRGAILSRYNWTCQKCKIRGGKLHAHHINNFADFPELRLAIDNGILFCKNCHLKFHKKYGQRNNTIEQIKEFYS